jgi:hypothetical protein
MRLSPWELNWLKQMKQAFRGSAEDSRWIRNIRRRHGLLKPIKPAIVSINVNAQRTLEEHLVYKRAMMRAAQIVCRAIKAGKLTHPTKLVCVDCKIRPATSYEHRDYAKPLDVDPICQSCNIKRGPAIISQPVPSNPNKARVRAIA